MDVMFAGRNAELTELESAIAEVRGGTSRVVLISGEAGVGKTALVRSFLRGCEVPTLTASGEQGEAALAFGVLEQLLVGVLALPEPLRHAVKHRAGDTMAVGASLVHALDRLGEKAPFVVWIDDAHWADAASMAALTFAMRRLEHSGTLVLLCTREEDISRLPRALVDGVQTGSSRLELGGLTADGVADVAAAAGRPVSRPVAERLTAHTGGNPLHLLALLEELGDEYLTAIDAEVLPAPRSFRALVAARLHRCGAEAEALAAACAVLGMRTSLARAARLARVENSLQLVDRLEVVGLLEHRYDREGRVVAFPHALVRAAIYHDLSEHRRAQLHAGAAELVDDEASSLWHRAAAAPGRDDALSQRLRELGHRDRGHGRTASAAGHLRLAARLALEPETRERLLLETLECHLIAGDPDEAVALADVLEGTSNGAYKTYLRARLALARGEPAEVERLLLESWARDDGSDPRLTGLIAGSLAAVCLHVGRFDEMCSWADASSRSATDVTPDDNSLSMRLIARALSGSTNEALGLLSSLPDRLAQPGDIDGVFARGILRMMAGDLPAAKTDLSDVYAVSTQAGLFHIGVIVLIHLADVAFRVGDWDQAISHSQLALSRASYADQSGLTAIMHAVAALPIASRGQRDDAELHLQVAEQAAAGTSMLADRVWTALSRARAARADAADQVVVAVLGPLAELEGARALSDAGFQPWRPLYAEGLVRTGRLEDAAKVLGELEMGTAPCGPSGTARVARVRGLLEIACGQPREAEHAFALAAHEAASGFEPFEQAMVALDHGTWLRRTGKRRLAATQLGAAKDILAALGSAPFERRCDDQLAACGLAPSKRRDLDRTRLTPRELAVARLVAQGLSNRGIADELVVTTKTVEFHLHNVFTKLGIASRSQLVRHLLHGPQD